MLALSTSVHDLPVSYMQPPIMKETGKLVNMYYRCPIIPPPRICKEEARRYANKLGQIPSGKDL